MDRNAIVEKLVLLNSHNPADCEGDLSTLCDINVRLTCDLCVIDLQTVTKLNENLHRFNPEDDSIIWKYVCLNFHFFDVLRDSLESTPSSDVLGVQQTKLLKTAVKNVVGIGIRCNLQPNMPGYRALPTQYVEECEPVLNSYNRLAAATFGLIRYLKCPKLRNVILSDDFKAILSSLYQIIYCPLKTPSTNIHGDVNSFVMTTELYARFSKEKNIFIKELEYLEKSLLKTLYIKETMLLPENNSPPAWFMKAIAQNLNNVITSSKGIETITWAMIDSSADYDPNDRAKNWKILEVISKLILNFHAKPEFEAIICRQMSDLLNLKDQSGKYIVPFENLYVLCVKKLFTLEENLCKRTLLMGILNQCRVFTDTSYEFQDNEKVTDLVVRIIRILYACFVENSADSLPIDLLAPFMAVIFELYAAHFQQNMQNELHEILVKYLNQRQDDRNTYFDVFLFHIPFEGLEMFRKDIYLESRKDGLFVKTSNLKNSLNMNAKGDALMKLCKTNTNLAVNLFIHLLNILIDQKKYLSTTNKRDLLEMEDEFILDETFQRKLIVYRLLSELTEDQLVQDNIQENPIEIIRYLQDFLEKTSDSEVHKSGDCDSESFQTLFTLVMILQALIANSNKHNHYKSLLSVLRLLFRESINVEFRNLLKSIIDILDDNNIKEKQSTHKTKSELEKALDDVCDPMLPVRGHGLMTLTKLIEAKEAETLERKNYILNIFQHNLKDTDTFIYLSSINGLAAMGYLFPDVILNIITDEYSDFTRRNAEDGLEQRMKVGEVLVRITKTLADMAPKYKSLLLNTFLAGTKDDDPFIRASSLSNLGEICRVLGYKLGTIVIEVLVCVHAIITTDKAVEARRAAVTVIKQLLAGLEVEMVTFLKDHILEIYRTLKRIYEGDKDDIMRLQAQLALEELNINVNKFLLAGSQLQNSKEFVLPESINSIRKF